MERPVAQAVAGPAHEQVEHGRIGGNGHLAAASGRAGMVLQELLRQPRQVPAYGFLQGLAFAMAGGTDAADDVGPKRALAVDCRRRRQDFSIRTVYQSCGQRRRPDINSQAIVMVRCQ